MFGLQLFIGFAKRQRKIYENIRIVKNSGFALELSRGNGKNGKQMYKIISFCQELLFFLYVFKSGYIFRTIFTWIFGLKL